jgi:DNA adenine methylase
MSAIVLTTSDDCCYEAGKGEIVTAIKLPVRQSNAEAVPPFLKWAGGKRWLTDRPELAELVPDVIDRYFEPFLGGAAVFFSLKPERAVLSDLNIELVSTYQAIRDDWPSVLRHLQRLNKDHTPEHYYQIRATSPRSLAKKAARFVYLNRVCWNGLYRVNRSGEFNVPLGSKTKVLLESDDFQAVAQRLTNVELNSCDFADTIRRAGKGDFIFADPPYTVRHNINGFIKYNENIFSWKDQIRLRNELRDAKKRGARILCTNADHSSVRDLYRADFALSRVERFSSIAGTGGKRGQFAELLISA